MSSVQSPKGEALMYLVYLGESGSTGTSFNDPNQPHHVYGGLMIHEDQWNETNAEFSQLCQRYFEHGRGEAGAPKELRATEMVHGKGCFSSWAKDRRLQLVDDLLGIVTRRSTPMIVTYVDKQEFLSARQDESDGPHRWRGPWEPAFSRFVFSLDLLMDELNMEAMSPEDLARGAPVKVRERAVIIADEANCTDPHFMQEFLKTEIDIPTGAVLESIHFSRAEESHFAQLADICTYFVRRHLQQPSRPNPQYSALETSRVIQVIYPVRV